MPEIIYSEFRKKFDLEKVNFNALDLLPKGKISLTSTIQYLDLLSLVRNYLEKKGNMVSVKKGAYYEGHVLGCNAFAYDKNCDIFLVLCDGKFHAMNNAILLDKEIYIFNSENLEKIDKKEIIDYKKKLEAKKKKFLTNTKIGLLVSIKPGQKISNLSAVKNKLEELNKRVYVFESDNVDINELENFPDINIFVNSACFGLARDDKKIINLQDVLEYFN